MLLQAHKRLLQASWMAGGWLIYSKYRAVVTPDPLLLICHPLRTPFDVLIA